MIPRAVNNRVMFGLPNSQLHTSRRPRKALSPRETHFNKSLTFGEAKKCQIDVLSILTLGIVTYPTAFSLWGFQLACTLKSAYGYYRVGINRFTLVCLLNSVLKSGCSNRKKPVLQPNRNQFFWNCWFRFGLCLSVTGCGFCVWWGKKNHWNQFQPVFSMSIYFVF